MYNFLTENICNDEENKNEEGGTVEMDFFLTLFGKKYFPSSNP